MSIRPSAPDAVARCLSANLAPAQATQLCRIGGAADGAGGVGGGDDVHVADGEPDGVVDGVSEGERVSVNVAGGVGEGEGVRETDGVGVGDFDGQAMTRTRLPVAVGVLSKPPTT